MPDVVTGDPVTVKIAGNDNATDDTVAEAVKDVITLDEFL